MSKGHGRNGFDGSYATSEGGKRSIEEEIERLAYNKDKDNNPYPNQLWSESDEGRGTIKEDLDTGRLDYWLQNTPGGKDYMHAYDDPSTGDRGYRDAGGNDHKCYLTTACLKHFTNKFDDNCHELTVLRWFRDNFVKPEDIALYYEVAPLIVEKIDSLPAKEQDDVYASIYKNVVDTCVHFIENGQYDDAYGRYMASTLSLRERFLPATI